MITNLANILTSPTMQNIAQNTTKAVTTETALKAIGRPGFTLMDKNVDKETRNYSAVKEFLYQTLCLGIYLAIIPPLFKEGGFQVAKKFFKSEGKHFPQFKSAKEFLNYHKLACMKLEDRVKETKILDKISGTLKEHSSAQTTIKQNLLTKYSPNKYPLVKGSIELCSIIGSVVGLTMLAPELSHLLLHPIMKAINLEPHKPGVTTDKQNNISVDTKA